MSKDKDFLEFKSTMKQVGDNLAYDCGNPAEVEDIFRDVVADAGDLVVSRNKKIADLEKQLKKSPKKSPEKSPKKCPEGKVLNPKTNRCIKIKEKKKSTPKKRGRPKKSVKKETVSKYHQKQYEKFVEKTDRDDLKEAFVEKPPTPEPQEETMYTRRKKRFVEAARPPTPPAYQTSFYDALEKYRTESSAGKYKTLIKSIYNKFGITLKWTSFGALYFMKKGKEASREEADEVKEYVVDYVSKKLKL